LKNKQSSHHYLSPFTIIPLSPLKTGKYKTITLNVVLYGCQTWYPTLRKERRLKVFENRLLWKIFGHKREEVAGGWRRLHNEELHTLYALPDINMVTK